MVSLGWTWASNHVEPNIKLKQLLQSTVVTSKYANYEGSYTQGILNDGCKVVNPFDLIFGYVCMSSVFRG